MNVIPGKPITVAVLSSSSRPSRRIIIPIDKRGTIGKREVWRSYLYKVGEPSWMITDVLFPLRYKVGEFKKIAIAEKQNVLKRLFDVWYVK